MSQNLTKNVETWVSPLCDELGLALYDVEHVGGVLRIVVDRDGGVPLDLIAKLTRSMSPILEEHDPINGKYTLEVSSPGLERRLRVPGHFQGAVGTTVKLKLRQGVAEHRRLMGRIVSADTAGVTLAVDDEAEARRVNYDDIESARTMYDWPDTSKPEKSQTKSSGTKKTSSSQSTSKKKAAS